MLLEAREAKVTSSFAREEKYREALLESTVDGLDERIKVATKAIEQRAEQLKPTSDGSGEEQRAIDDAKRVLRVLTRSKRRAGRSTKAALAQTELAS
jgi:hypothetical protein